MLASCAQARLVDRDWKLRESAILALGAVAEGCTGGLVTLAPQIIDGLMPMLADPRPLVRRLAAALLRSPRSSRADIVTPPGGRCGASRAGRWGATASGWCHKTGSHSRRRRKRAWRAYWPASCRACWTGACRVAGALRAACLTRVRVRYRSKPVQAAACSGLATLAEQAGAGLTPQLEPILTQLMAALNMVRVRSCAVGVGLRVSRRCILAVSTQECAARVRRADGGRKRRWQRVGGPESGGAVCAATSCQVAGALPLRAIFAAPSHLTRTRGA
jgi:hypothetical protein